MLRQASLLASFPSVGIQARPLVSPDAGFKTPASRDALGLPGRWLGARVVLVLRILPDRRQRGVRAREARGMVSGKGTLPDSLRRRSDSSRGQDSTEEGRRTRGGKEFTDDLSVYWSGQGLYGIGDPSRPPRLLLGQSTLPRDCRAILRRIHSCSQSREGNL